MNSRSLLLVCATLLGGVAPSFAQQPRTTTGAPKKSTVAVPGASKQSGANAVQSAVDAYVRSDHAAAFAEWHRLADQGNGFAQVQVAGMFCSGEGTPKDEKQCSRYALMAAKQGDSWAASTLAFLLRRGVGVEKDLVGAQKWQETSKTSRPSPKLQRDYAEGASYIRRAAEQGKPVAERMLAGLYSYGRGVPKDESEYWRWIQKAAGHGDGAAMYSVAFSYRYGTSGRRKDLGEAVVWLRKAAEAGHSWAQSDLANMYGQGDGVPKDYAEAESWYLKAAKDPERSVSVKGQLA